ncbi:LacI family DNA-binding transcriptional regulator [Alteromonas sp. S167]|uniref:LacI family DNA-binding transcriptional regulator n=1 Tax=Alteromonas sp. S167 TaxID=3117402 RepID=UPI002FE16FF2
MKKTKLTLKDVALQLGVSTATISNAFNRPDQLSASKREEILSQCKKIGYSGPNKAAQILRKGKSNIVALVLADSISYMVSDPVASTFIKGVSGALQKEGKHLLLYPGDSKSILDVVDFVDGFICYGAPRNAMLVDELAVTPKPIVTVDFDIDDKPSINIDNEEAAFEVADHALNEGDNLAIFGLRLIDSPSTCRIYDNPLIGVESSISHRRLDGYLRAAKAKNVNVSRERIWHLPESERSFARQAAKELLTSSPRPNVVLCMSDIIALELLHLALDMGIKVPEELRITGFDGIEESQRTRPTLTTVCQSSAAKGENAALVLLQAVSGKTILPFEMRRGETV